MPNICLCFGDDIDEDIRNILINKNLLGLDELVIGAVTSVFIIPSKRLVIVRTGLKGDPNFDVNEFIKNIVESIS